MSESTNYNHNSEGIGVETVGETLHRERLTRNILIETLSLDLKLSEKFIVGIEESNYKDLPSIPYIRVYIKSIAQYLTLDSEELLNRFSQEQSLSIPDPDEERRDTISISVQKDAKQSPIVPIIFVVVAIIAAIFLLKKPVSDESLDGFDSSDDSTSFEETANPDIADDSITQDMVDILDSIPEDSLDATTDDSTTSLIDTTEEETVVIAEVEKKSFLFAVSGVRDSAWMKVFVDGSPQFNGLIRKDDNLHFEAQDSINIRNGANRAVAYSRDGVLLAVGGTSPGIKYAKVTSDTTILWRKSQWERVFSGR